MRFSAIAKGTRAVKPVKFRLANAPPPPPPSAEQVAAGDSVVPDPGEITVGVRVLTVGEIGDVFELAQRDAASKGVKEWNKDHPICRLRQMVRTVHVACVDVDDSTQPFFESVEQIDSSFEVGTDNIALLFEQQDEWQQECSFGNRSKKLSMDQMIGLIAQEAERDENALSPFSQLRPGLAANCTHFMARLFMTSLMGKSLSSFTDDTSTPSTPTSQESPSPTPEPAP